jgi:hypothetical protein
MRKQCFEETRSDELSIELPCVGDENEEDVEPLLPINLSRTSSGVELLKGGGKLHSAHRF